MPILTLLTDFGTRDAYVAAVKGTVLRLAPSAHLVDLCHDVPPGDIDTAAYLLAYAAPTFPPETVHLAVVDPGVGSARRLLALSTSFGTVLAPDNGLLSPLLDRGEARHIERRELYLSTPGQTFHGRDRLAPVGAFLLNGGSMVSLGPVVSDAVRLPLPAPKRGTELLTGRIVHIDHYGNVITDIPSAWIEGDAIVAMVGGREVRRRAHHYAELAKGEIAVLAGSAGTIEIAANAESAARLLSAERGDRVEIRLTTKPSAH